MKFLFIPRRGDNKFLDSISSLEKFTPDVWYKENINESILECEMGGVLAAKGAPCFSTSFDIDLKSDYLEEAPPDKGGSILEYRRQFHSIFNT